jgi:MGT family glycosyltransferase
MALRIVEEGLAAVPALIEQARALTPDVIAFDFMAPAGRIIAEHLKVPAVRLCSTYATNEHFSLSKVAKERGATFDLSILEPVRALGEELVARYHVKPIVFPGIFNDPAELNVVFMSRAFQPAGDTFDPSFVFVGPSLNDQPESSDFPLDELERRGAPILLISLGTVLTSSYWPEFSGLCFEAFGGAPWTVVLSAGENADPALVARAPANFIVRPRVPQLSVLKRARAFVTHGGMNSTQEALFFGVPLVVIPQLVEQAATAARVAELGLGVALERETTTAGTLAAAVARVSTDTSIAEQVARMQVHTREAGGYLRAAQAILDFASRASC